MSDFTRPGPNDPHPVNNRPVVENLFTVFEGNSTTTVTGWFDYDCQKNGARRALEGMYEQLYKSIYHNQPPPRYLAKSNEDDEHKSRLKRSYAFITIRPKYSSIENDIFPFKQWCEDIADSFRFIYTDSKDNLYRWETVDGDAKSLHFHGVFKLSAGYTPSQIRNQLISRKDTKKWFLPHPRVAVNVKKINSYDLKTVQDYIKKGDFPDPPSEYSE